MKQKRKSLRPRSKTSLNLGHAAEASDADDSTDTDEGFATRGSKGRSKRHKRQITAVDQETDNEPAQLMTMQPVSCATTQVMFRCVTSPLVGARVSWSCGGRSLA